MSELVNVRDLAGALEDVPIFPLPQVVLFPRALLPLHVFEPRYRALLKDSLAGHGFIVMALLQDGPEDAYGNPPVAEVAGIGGIVERQMLPDGRANVVLLGRARVRIEEKPFVAPYRRARATLLDEAKTGITQSDRIALVHAAANFAGEVQRRDPKFSFTLPPNVETGTIADLCAHHLIINAAKRQTVLEELDVAKRVRMVLSELATQHAALAREARNATN